MIKWPEILPPADLLKQVEGVESGLRQRRRLAGIGGVGLVVSAALQAALTIANSQWLQDLKDAQWSRLASQWPYLLPLLLLILFVFLLSWSRFWLEESRQPFRYTCSIDPFLPLDVTEKDEKLSWLSHDLTCRLSQRVGRFRFVDPKELNPETAKAFESHIHMRGVYVIRRQRDQRWALEVTPRIRLGLPGNPETIARPVVFDLGLEDHAQALDAEKYEKVLERVYFSLATEIYHQIQENVRRKIELLPAAYFRAVALLHEAEDYARSNTLDSYEQARKLFAEAFQLFDPCLRERPETRWLRMLRVVWSWVVRRQQWMRRVLIHLAPRRGQVEVYCARAEIGYANMLLFRRTLAILVGRRLNPVFPARRIARRAVQRLERLPADVPGQRDALFDGCVTLALALHQLGSLSEPEQWLDRARRLDSWRSEQDARYLFVRGELEPDLRSQMHLFTRAVEREPRFEIGQWSLAYSVERLWRTRPTMEPTVAQLAYQQFEAVIGINPGNLGAWANRGYMRWLQDQNTEAKNDFANGREYKSILRETFVSELEYGLARIAAEEGAFKEAYEHYIGAISALAAEGAFHGAYSAYYFDLISEPMWRRFDVYCRKVKSHWEKLNGKEVPESTQRIRNSVLSFVLNDYGEACAAYYRRSGDPSKLTAAQAAFEAAIGLNEGYWLPRFNLYQLEWRRSRYAEAVLHVEKVVAVQPRWPYGTLDLAAIHADWATSARQQALLKRARAKERGQEAAEKKALALKKRSENRQPDTGARSPNPFTGFTELSRNPQDPENRNREQEADRLEKEAAALEQDAQGLTQAADELEHQAQESERLARELPRDWLPASWLRAVEGHSGKRWRPATKEMETDLDEVPAQALLRWATALLAQIRYSGEAVGLSREQVEWLVGEIDRCLWMDNFDLIVIRRNLATDQAETESLNVKIRKAVASWMIRDRTAYISAIWLTDRAFGATERQQQLRQAAEQPQLSPFLYCWLGDQLTGSEAIAAYRRAMRMADERLLVELGEKFERLQVWEEGLSCYHQALRRHLAAMEEGGNPPGAAGLTRPQNGFSRNFYHERIGRVLWARGEAAQAVAEFEAIELSGGGQDSSWRTHVVTAVLPTIQTEANYRLVREWLERWLHIHRKRKSEAAVRDAGDAIFRLVEGWFQRAEGPQQFGLMTTPIAVELDAGLVPAEGLAEGHPIFKKYIPEMRERIHAEMGLRIPRVRLRSNNEMPSNSYLFLIREVPRVIGHVVPLCRFYPHIDRMASRVAGGIADAGPAYNPQTEEMDGAWLEVRPPLAEEESWDYFEYLTLHLESWVRHDLQAFLGYQEVENMLRSWQTGAEDESTNATRRELVTAALPDARSRTRFGEVLRKLVDEFVPITDLHAILTVFRAGQSQEAVVSLAESARRQFREQLPGNNAGAKFVRLSRYFEEAVLSAIVPGGIYLQLEPEKTQEILDEVRALVDKTKPAWPVLVTEIEGIRRFVRKIIEIEFPRVMVLSSRELKRDWRKRVVESARATG